MISESAQNSFASIFIRSIEKALESNKDGSHWDIHPLSSAEKIIAQDFILTTLCSYQFRLFTTLHFSYSLSILEDAAEVLKLPKEKMTKEKFNDCMKEKSLTLSDTVKESLEGTFPHLGISEPEFLKQQSHLFFDSNHYEYTLHNSATSKKNICLFFGLYVCPFEDLDFEVAIH
ncbi:MAG: hypothetical protein HQM14_09605 [SAR324 cluster bacterium]|nr:hypothetical protein [SAR324 cluster bacterium]